MLLRRCRWCGRGFRFVTRSSVTAESASVGAHYVFRGHSRSPSSVWIESPCATSCYWNFFISYTVSKLLRITEAFFAAVFYALVLDKPPNSRLWHLASRNKKNIALSYRVNMFRYSKPFGSGSRVWQTDRQTEWPLAIALSNAVGRVLIMMLCNVDDHCR